MKQFDPGLAHGVTSVGTEVGAAVGSPGVMGAAVGRAVGTVVGGGVEGAVGVGAGVESHFSISPSAGPDPSGGQQRFVGSTSNDQKSLAHSGRVGVSPETGNPVCVPNVPVLKLTTGV